MKSLVYTNPKTLEFRESPNPTPNSDEVLVKVEAVGICGSDMHGFLGHDERRQPPLILGHEIAGIIESGPDKGARVTVNPLISCQQCHSCQTGQLNVCNKRELLSLPPRQGGFAEYVAVPLSNVLKVPKEIDAEYAALTEPFACGWHAVRLASEKQVIPLQESNCLVIGGGAIGLGAALALNIKGAKQIVLTETNPIRVEELKKYQQFSVKNPINDANFATNEFDLIIDAVGLDQTRETAMSTIRSGGTIVNIGLADGNAGLNIRHMTLQEITFFGTYTYTPSDFEETATNLFKGSYGPIHNFETYPLSQGQQAFDGILEQKISASKVILIP